MSEDTCLTFFWLCTCGITSTSSDCRFHMSLCQLLTRCAMIPKARADSPTGSSNSKIPSCLRLNCAKSSGRTSLHGTLFSSYVLSPASVHAFKWTIEFNISPTSPKCDDHADHVKAGVCIESKGHLLADLIVDEMGMQT